MSLAPIHKPVATARDVFIMIRAEGSLNVFTVFVRQTQVMHVMFVLTQLCRWWKMVVLNGTWLLLVTVFTKSTFRCFLISLSFSVRPSSCKLDVFPAARSGARRPEMPWQSTTCLKAAL